MSLAVVALLIAPPLLQQETPAVHPGAARSTGSFREARATFKTQLTRNEQQGTPLAVPPEELFSVVYYDAPSGKTAAYLSASPQPGLRTAERRPAIVWVTGGFPAARGGSGAWLPGPPDNDQSATAFRDAGAVMLFPTVRGTAENPGFQEVMFGEVDDVIAAGEYLRSLDHVDPDRVYLGGHSTGGTLVLLVAEATDIFRATFSFGPVARTLDYGDRGWPIGLDAADEWWMRAPIHHLEEIQTPTFVIEGRGGNISDLEEIRETTANPNVRCIDIDFADHFSVLFPTNALLASAVMQHADGAFDVKPAAIRSAFRDYLVAQRESRDRALIDEHLADGAREGESRHVVFRVRGWDEAAVLAAREALAKQGFRIQPLDPYANRSGDLCHPFEASRTLIFRAREIHAASAAVRAAVEAGHIIDEGWTSPGPAPL